MSELSRRQLLSLPFSNAPRESTRLRLVSEAQMQTAELGTTTPKADSNVVSLAALLDEPDNPRQWVVDELLPAGGMSILVAKPKVGKSTLARTLALHVARGKSFLDRKTIAGSVLYLDLEESREQVRPVFRRIGAGEDPIFVGTSEWLDSDRNVFDMLAESIRYERPALAIIGPLLDFLPGLDDLNEYAQVRRALRPLVNLARESGAHILAIHHLRKGSSHSTDSILGSSALFASVDTVLTMWRHAESRFITSLEAQRYGTELPLTALVMDVETGVIKPAGDQTAVAQYRFREVFLDALADGKRLLKQSFIESIPGDINQKRRALEALIAEQIVISSGPGKKGKPEEVWLAPSESESDLDIPDGRLHPGEHQASGMSDEALHFLREL